MYLRGTKLYTSSLRCQDSTWFSAFNPDIVIHKVKELLGNNVSWISKVLKCHNYFSLHKSMAILSKDHNILQQSQQSSQYSICQRSQEQVTNSDHQWNLAAVVSWSQWMWRFLETTWLTCHGFYSWAFMTSCLPFGSSKRSLVESDKIMYKPKYRMIIHIRRGNSAIHMAVVIHPTQSWDSEKTCVVTFGWIWKHTNKEKC